MMANYFNEYQTEGENPSWSRDEKPLSSCDKRILQIAQKANRGCRKYSAQNSTKNRDFWETVHVIDSQSHVPFGAVSAR
jgi:hypothetical protein